jgi:hypothetical protein
MIQGVCKKRKLLDLVENFILFDDRKGEPTGLRSAWYRSAPRLRPGSVCQRIMPHVTHRRQGDLPCPFQHQEQAPTHHVAQRAVGLAPLPGLSQHG